jgi:3-isopropylmalate/(R)-2-methylmalate dehydratase small subunit
MAITPFKTHRGKLVTLDRANVDTDQIIPKQFLKSIKRTGFGEHLFDGWRYLPNGKPNPNFELNRSEFKGASILVARNNFGSGSSREHAVWAVQQYGFKAVIAPSFADIFKTNCSKNGLLTIVLKEAEVEEIFQSISKAEGLEITVNLEEQQVTLHLSEEISFRFEVEPAVKEQLIKGLDPIGLALEQKETIEAFEARHQTQYYT